MLHKITAHLDGTQTEEYIPEPILDENGMIQYDENGNIIMETIPE